MNTELTFYNAAPIPANAWVLLNTELTFDYAAPVPAHLGGRAEQLMLEPDFKSEKGPAEPCRINGSGSGSSRRGARAEDVGSEADDALDRAAGDEVASVATSDRHFSLDDVSRLLRHVHEYPTLGEKNLALLIGCPPIKSQRSRKKTFRRPQNAFQRPGLKCPKLLFGYDTMRRTTSRSILLDKGTFLGTPNVLFQLQY